MFWWGIIFMAVFLSAGAAADADEEYPDPHWKSGFCYKCHEEGWAEKGKNPKFKYDGDINKLCNSCHDVVSAHAYIHATGMIPSDEKLGVMSEEFKKALYRGDKEGKMTCIVCHELTYQCLEEEYKRKMDNPRFFRGGPYMTRTSMCYRCHEARQYERLNPHDQINDEGYMVENVCTFCHKVMPDRKRVRGIGDVTFRAEGDLAALCTGCHPVSKHPMWQTFKQITDIKSHLVVPSFGIFKKMKRSEDKAVLPLDTDTGRIFCGTCHNPHEKGIQRNSVADAGADGYKRLRVGSEGNMVICTMCHEPEQQE
ncbi:MAG: hypothetical protein A2073_01470 [Deltaproteobacteria bacterium GWC2_42_11]|nr:MAG: hypothetical protein A2073_01470 [Deltaproteobacteria bacterium GWC2_42_11]HBO84849.1 hypothetical protein [Deltaproteobacteria bacterium]